jgi:hypothetical protein
MMIKGGVERGSKGKSDKEGQCRPLKVGDKRDRKKGEREGM